MKNNNEINNEKKVFAFIEATPLVGVKVKPIPTAKRFYQKFIQEYLRKALENKPSDSNLKKP